MVIEERRHEPATCDVLFCQFCDGYASGYVQGKDKTVQDILDRLEHTHGSGCGCTPCSVVRAVAEKLYLVVFSPNEPTLWGDFGDQKPVGGE